MVGAADEVEVPAEREAPESPEAPDLSNKINAPCDVPDRPDPPDAIGMNFTIIFTELAAAARG